MPSGLGGPRRTTRKPKRTTPRRGYPGVNPQRRAEVKVIDFNGMIRNLDWHPVYQAPWRRFHFGLAIGFRYKGLVFFSFFLGGNGWNFYNLMFEAVRTVTNTTLPGLKLKVVRRSKSWKSTAGFQFFWGYLWHEAVEWEPVRRPNLQLDIWHLEVVFADLVDRLWIMLPRFASNTSKYTPGHEQQERERERECKSRLSASNGSLVFAVARTQPICLSLQMNALSIYRHWLDWCKVSRIKMKNVWQLLPPAEKPEACRRTWVVSGDLRFVVKSYSLCL